MDEQPKDPDALREELEQLSDKIEGLQQACQEGISICRDDLYSGRPVDMDDGRGPLKAAITNAGDLQHEGISAATLVEILIIASVKDDWSQRAIRFAFLDDAIDTLPVQHGTGIRHDAPPAQGTRTDFRTANEDADDISIRYHAR